MSLLYNINTLACIITENKNMHQPTKQSPASTHPQQKCKLLSDTLNPYEQGICHLFEFIENSMLGQSSKIIRGALYLIRCIWHQVLMNCNGGLFCQGISQDQLDSVINIFLARLRFGGGKANNVGDGSLSQYSYSVLFQTQFENLSNPYQTLQNCKEALTPQILEAAAELMTLSLTKIHFSSFEPAALGLGCIAAIKQHKNLKSEPESFGQQNGPQISEIKTLYLKLLSEIDKIQIDQFQQ